MMKVLTGQSGFGVCVATQASQQNHHQRSLNPPISFIVPSDCQPLSSWVIPQPPSDHCQPTGCPLSD